MKVVPQKVDLIDHMGNDLSVVNAARVSFGKVVTELTEKDARLINYLAKHNHWTPFAHTSITLRIKCPIFVARQLGKHQVGLVWNEVSRRYVDEEPEFFFPDEWRGKPLNAKQGSSAEAISLTLAYGLCDEEGLVETPWEVMKSALQLYLGMIRQGVAPEQARMVLPQNMMTKFIWTGSLAAFVRVCKLRLDPHTQKETQDVAKEISTILESLYPHSYKALMGETND